MIDPQALLKSPMHHAASTGDVAELGRLLALGADINAPMDLAEDYGLFYKGLTPLMIAACSDLGATVETIGWLIDQGADISIQSAGGVTAAWYAAGKGIVMKQIDDIAISDQAERLRIFLSAGLDPNETSANGRSLLTEACIAGAPTRVALLLEQGVTAQPIFDAEAEKAHRQRPAVPDLPEIDTSIACRWQRSGHGSWQTPDGQPGPECQPAGCH